jgi:hypothetical protein
LSTASTLLAPGHAGSPGSTTVAKADSAASGTGTGPARLPTATARPFRTRHDRRLDDTGFVWR